MNQTELQIAVVGAGPVGLAFACACARALPQARIQLFDALPLDGSPRRDARTLALSLGSIQWLRRLGQWPEAQAEAMHEVSISQAPPGRTDLRLRAADMGVPQLGAVLAYADLVAAQQRAWIELATAQPGRHGTRGNTRVQALKTLDDGRVELDSGVAEVFDLVVLAEGGLFSDQVRKPWRRDYAQTAWVGSVQLGLDWPRGLAVERFTRDGPLAVLPTPDADGQRRAALVWCTPPDETPDSLSLERLRALLPRGANQIEAMPAPLKPFALGLNAESQPHQGRVLRIGNAAQTLHPVAGQGLNLGLRDAHTLVTLLRDGGDLDRALRRYVPQRRPDRLALLATTDLLARVFAIDAAPVSLAREAGLRLLQAVPPLRHGLARQLMFGWR